MLHKIKEESNLLKFDHMAVAYEPKSTHPNEECENCSHYIAGKVPRCEGVRSPIAPEAWCVRWDDKSELK